MLEFIYSFGLYKERINYILGYFCRAARTVLVDKGIVTALFESIKLQSAHLNQSASHSEFPLETFDPRGTLSLFQELQSQANSQGISRFDSSICPLSPLLFLFFQSNKNFFNSFFSKDMIDATQIQSFQFYSLDVELTDQIVFFRYSRGLSSLISK